MSLKSVRIPGVGMRNVKTALAAAFCAFIYYFFDRSPAFACIGAIFGIGFPPFLGGPFRYMDSLGIDYLVGRLEHHQKRFGDRFAPCARLKAMAAEQQRFYG